MSLNTEKAALKEVPNKDQAQETRELWMADLAKSAAANEIRKVQNVPDEPEEESEAHAPENLSEVLRAEDPRNLGKGLRTMQGLVEEFASAKDKPKALGQMRDGFEEAVKQTDRDFEETKTRFEQERLKLKPEMEPRVKAFETAAQNMGAALGKLPKEEQERMTWLMGGYKNGKNSPELDAAIAKEVNKHPGLLPALENGIKAQTELAPYMQKAKELKDSMDTAVAERVAGRQVYSEVLKEGGDLKRSQRMEMEARALTMGIPLEQLDALEKRQKN